ncbi:hypothetical protein C8Q77DRAFT_1156558 [Trametes polyzona]|nr:hypothetical protein C8Q77DRAFT_1156558 [Trametes polyzona]
MEYFKARLDSFGPPKNKRTKASSSKQASASAKWPHPPTWKATPDSLAEAGFYYNPSPHDPDNVTCFMCKKDLCGWEPEDDPFEIHYEKCSDVCAWAVVRCQKPDANGRYDFSDPARHPTSKAMEKARLDTFAKVQWPHDGVKKHGANSPALAKAGFVCNALEPGDDTALCLYCNLSLGGWDTEDDPYEEHLKRRAKKHKIDCAFLRAHGDDTLGKSTSKRPSSKTVARPPSRSASQTLQKAPAEPQEGESEDELAAPSSGTIPPRGSSARTSKSRTSRASSAPAKTPASRRSTRGTGTSGKTPGSRVTVSSEVEETDHGSESESGKRVSKSKRKTGGRAKTRVSAIAEEEADEAPGEDHAVEDVEMQGEEEHEPAQEKRKRGRPPKVATVVAKPAPKGRAKVVADEDESEAVADTDHEPAPPPPPKKAHGRTRSKANVESETEAPAPRSMHTRTKSGSRAKVKHEEEEVQVPAPSKKGKQKAVPAVVEDEEEEDRPAPPPKGKGKARAVPRTKVKEEPDEPLQDDVVPSHDEIPEPPGDVNTSARSAKASSKRTPSLSDDAGYATAEAPVDADAMDVDGDEPPRPPPAQQTKPRKVAPNGTHAALQRTSSRSTPPSADERAKRPSPAVIGVVRSSVAPPSRASSARPPSRISSQRPVNKESLKVIEIDSDGEESAPEAPPRKPKTVERTLSINGAKPPSKTPAKKLQVEVVLPSKTKPPPQEPEDVRMKEASPASPARAKVDRSPSPPQVAYKGEPSETPVSAVHRSAQVSPARPPAEDAAEAGDVPMKEEPQPAAAASTSPRTYHPVLAQVPIEKLTSLTEEEADMTLEQYIRRETELQYAQFKADAERRIEEFKRRAAEARKLIETS